MGARAAHVPVVCVAEPEGRFKCAGHANPWSNYDRLVGLKTIVGDPQRFAFREIPAVQLSVDIQRLTKPRRAADEIEELVGAAAELHELDANEWLQRSNQDRAATVFGLRDCVQAPLGMNRVDIRVAGMSE